jgi:hypothetical protein
MAPVAYGIMATVGAAILVAILVGAIGGTINGRLKGDLFLGALSVLGTYLVALAVMGDLWLVPLAAMLPLILTFLFGSLVARYLETRAHLRPLFATLGALGTALFAGFLYLMLIRFGSWAWADPRTAWIALGILLYLIILSIQKRVRAVK